MAMKYSIEGIDIQAIKKEAETLYGNDFYCSEAILYTLHKHFKLECPVEVVSVASAAPVGVGGAGCICGALNGGLMALGLFFGRSEKQGKEVAQCMELGNELHEWFRKETEKNSVCCRVLTRGMDMKSGEHMEQCIKFTGLVAMKTAEIIVRESKR